MLGIGLGLNKLRSSGLSNILLGAMVWGFRSKYKWSQTSTDIWGFANPNDVDPEAQAVYDRIIADGGVSNITRLNYFVVGLKTIYGTLANVPVCYDAHWIGYKLGSGTGATAGQAAAKLYSLTVAGDAVQSTAASQPLLLSHNGSDNYYFQSGTSGNYITSPSATANQITGTVDFDYSFIVQANNSATFGKIGSNGSAPSYAGFISTSTVQYVDSLGNYNSIVNIASFLPAVGNLFYVRLTLQGTTATCFTSIDGTSWTSRGTAIVAPLITSNTSTLTFSSGSAVSNPQKAYRMRIYNGIRDSGGTLVADCNPATYNASTSQTAWTSATGEVWTINTGTATSGYKGVLVDRTTVQGDGVDDGIESGTLNIGFPRTQFTSFKLLQANNSGATITDGTGAGVPYVSRLGFTSTTFLFYAGSSSQTVVDSVLKTKLYTSIFDSTAAQNLLNNANQISSFANVPINMVTMRLFRSNLGAQYGNFNITTIIISNSVNTANNTATYNLIRSLNNNAF